MRYKSVNDLPEVLRNLLPNKEAQKVYLEVYNETWDAHNQDEERGRYRSVNDLPEVLRNLLPNKEAQKVYLGAYNETWDAYNQEEEKGQRSRDAEAHRDGWAAVQRAFVHDEEKGGWYRKGEAYKEEKAEGFIEKIKSLVT